MARDEAACLEILPVQGTPLGEVVRSNCEVDGFAVRIGKMWPNTLERPARSPEASAATFGLRPLPAP